MGNTELEKVYGEKTGVENTGLEKAGIEKTGGEISSGEKTEDSNYQKNKNQGGKDKFGKRPRVEMTGVIKSVGKTLRGKTVGRERVGVNTDGKIKGG